MQIYRNQTAKPVGRFVLDLEHAAHQRGFFLHNQKTMAMANTFGQHGIAVAEGFDLHMIHLCKPAKAARILENNPERAALMPKFIMVFSAQATTQIRFLHYRSETVFRLLGDAEFPVAIAASLKEIITVIENAL